MGETKAFFINEELPIEEGRELLLVERAVEGQEQAFREIVKTHETMVFNLALRCVGNFDDACDISQDVFLKAFMNLRRFRGESSLKTWLYRITLNIVANRSRWWKRKKRGRALSLDTGMKGKDFNWIDRIPSPLGTPEEEAARGQVRRQIFDALERLAPNQRAVVVLRDIEGLGYDEIASLLKVSMGTVKSRLARGRERVRGLLEQDEQQESCTPSRGPRHGEEDGNELQTS